MKLCQALLFVASVMLPTAAEASVHLYQPGGSLVNGLSLIEEHSTARSLKQTNHASAVSSKIVGGQYVAPGSYTFVASLRKPAQDAAPGTHFCGGALIAENVVATAAHCLKLVEGSFPVHVGRHDRNGADMGRFEAFTVVRSIVHPSYEQGAKINNDIALLVLNKKSSERPVQLRTSDVCFEGEGCGFGEVFGWGWTRANNRDSAANSLMSVRLPLMSRSSCRQHYGYSRITNAMVCAGGNAGEDACQGDSGGPLLVINKLSGLVSFGPDECGTRHPGVYTNIAYLYGWIQDQLKMIKQDTSYGIESTPRPSSSRCRFVNGKWYPLGC